MIQILKRLEIIKSSIAIEEDEIIELQITKLTKLDIDDDVKIIVKKLENMNYVKALKEIDAYLSKYNGVVKYVDGEIQGLKLELKSLESSLQKLTEEKLEYLNDIEEFNTQYNLHLGKLIKVILELKKEILHKQIIKQQKEKDRYQEDLQTFEETKETIDELNSTISELEEALESIDEDDENYEELSKAYAELKEEVEKLKVELEAQEEELSKTKEFIEDETIEEEYEEIKSHYEEYENEYNHIQEEQESKININDEEKKELKTLFRKAARLCHPDIVIDNLKEKAHELMQKLNDAYSKQDLKQVKEILHTLETGEVFEVSSDAIEDKELLIQKIKEYKDSIKDIESELKEIKEDDTYQTISKLDSWDEYFEELKSGLEDKKVELQKGVKEFTNEIDENQIPDWVQKVWNWAEKKETDFEIIPKDNQTLQNLKAIEIDILIYDDNLLYPQELLNFKNLEKLVIGYFMAEHLNSIEAYYNKFFTEIVNTQLKIKELGLIELQISFVPNNLSNLKLERLCLWSNKIESLPDSIGDITTLTILELADNNLLKLPDTIVNLNNLANLELKQNNNLTLTDKQIEWIIKLEENDCKVELDDYLSEIVSDYKIENIKKTTSSSQATDFDDRSYSSSNSSLNYMGDGMYINDNDRWW